MRLIFFKGITTLDLITTTTTNIKAPSFYSFLLVKELIN